MEAGDKHVPKDEEITEKEMKAAQRKLNATTSMFVKIFKMGENQDQTHRHRGNVMSQAANPAAMKLMHKDHKRGEEVHMRRYNGPGMNVHMSNLLAELLEPIADEMEDKHERGSTEAVLNMGDEYNEKEEEVQESEVDGDI